jgi:hypothetical protein
MSALERDPTSCAFAPIVIPAVARLDLARETLFRTVAQLTLNYRDGPLSEGHAAHLHGGDRLPWIKSADQENFAILSTLR